jgi:hypothetical protein
MAMAWVIEVLLERFDEIPSRFVFSLAAACNVDLDALPDPHIDLLPDKRVILARRHKSRPESKGVLEPNQVRDQKDRNQDRGPP